MARDWPAFKDMNWLRLHEGPADLNVLDIAPTMKHIIVKGAKYFRMSDQRSVRQEGEPAERTERGGSYLWDGWWAQKLAEVRAKEPARTEAHP